MNNTLRYAKIRVCWHEIGHFVAAYYNQQHFGGFGTDYIELTRVGNDYEGDHKPLKAKGDANDVPNEHPYTLVASLAYGCIFQSVLLKSPWGQCFNGRPGHHGACDVNRISSVAEKFHIIEGEKGQLFNCIDTYYERVKDNQELKDLLSQDIYELVKSDEDVFRVDLQAIKHVLTNFLLRHEPYYIAFVSELYALFAPHLTE